MIKYNHIAFVAILQSFFIVFYWFNNMFALDAVQEMHLTTTSFKVLFVVLRYDSLDNELLIVTSPLSFCNATSVADMEHITIYRVYIMYIRFCERQLLCLYDMFCTFLKWYVASSFVLR